MYQGEQRHTGRREIERLFGAPRTNLFVGHAEHTEGTASRRDGQHFVLEHDDAVCTQGRAHVLAVVPAVVVSQHRDHPEWRA
jgi:hypothetical protein